MEDVELKQELDSQNFTNEILILKKIDRKLIYARLLPHFSK
jgi:hypothetical protein